MTTDIHADRPMGDSVFPNRELQAEWLRLDEDALAKGFCPRAIMCQGRMVMFLKTYVPEAGNTPAQRYAALVNSASADRPGWALDQLPWRFPGDGCDRWPRFATPEAIALYDRHFGAGTA